MLFRGRKRIEVFLSPEVVGEFGGGGIHGEDYATRIILA